MDKPAGPTSHDVVDRVRRVFGTRRVGHTGTLDPFATGVLVLCLGRATRLAALLGAGLKVYLARVRLGFATTTDDLTGEPLGTARTPVSIDRAAVEAAAQRFMGTIEQVPPAFSAKRVGGRRLYELARRGEPVERKPSTVTILEIGVGEIALDTFELRVRCSAGTYVRALARDLGEALGTGGHLVSLRRTASGEFDEKDAVPWGALGDRATCTASLKPLEALATHLPAVRVGRVGREAFCHGRLLERREVEASEWVSMERVRVFDERSSLLGLGNLAEDGLHPSLVLVD